MHLKLAQNDQYFHLFRSFPKKMKNEYFFVILHCSANDSMFNLLQIRNNFERNPHKDVVLPIRRETLDHSETFRPETSLATPSSFWPIGGENSRETPPKFWIFVPPNLGGTEILANPPQFGRDKSFDLWGGRTKCWGGQTFRPPQILRHWGGHANSQKSLGGTKRALGGKCKKCVPPKLGGILPTQ